MVQIGLRCSLSACRNCAQTSNHEVDSTAHQVQEMKAPMPFSSRRNNDPKGEHRGILLLMSELSWERGLLLARHSKEFLYIRPMPTDETGCLELCVEQNLKAEPRPPGKCAVIDWQCLPWPGHD